MSLPSEPDVPAAGVRTWSPSELAELAIASLDASGHLTPASAERLWRLIRRFGTFVERAHGLQLASDISPKHVRSFLEASTGSGTAPSAATMHLRRTAVRLLFRQAAKHGAGMGDPTAGIELPPRSYLSFRPLADDEIELGRSFARNSLSATREPAAWALSEAGARTSELPGVRVCDVDLNLGVVRIAGGAKTAPRWGSLTAWGLVQLRRRIEHLEAQGPEVPLICAELGGRTRARANAYASVRASLVRAGLGDEPGVCPNSVVAWRGASAIRAGSSIEQVARMLGIRSLDRTASFIGWDWAEAEP
jgi:integrase